MNDRQIDCFLTVAQMLSFQKAADELYVTQPAVSYQIGALEHELGLQLFIRDRHSIKLTPAGESLSHDLTQAREITVRAISRAQEIARYGESSELVLVYHPSLDSDCIARLVKSFSSEMSQYSLSLRCRGYSSSEIVSLIQTGRADVAFCLAGDILNHTDLRFRPLYTAPAYCVMSPDNALASHEDVNYGSFHDQTFVRFPAKRTARVEEIFYERAFKASPTAQQRVVEDQDEMTALVKANVCVRIQPLSEQQVHNCSNSGLVAVPLDIKDVRDLGACWCIDNETEQVRRLVDMAVEAFAF